VRDVPPNQANIYAEEASSQAPLTIRFYVVDPTQADMNAA